MNFYVQAYKPTPKKPNVEATNNNNNEDLPNGHAKTNGHVANGEVMKNGDIKANGEITNGDVKSNGHIKNGYMNGHANGIKKEKTQ